jgi:hypothetical protein
VRFALAALLAAGCAAPFSMVKQGGAREGVAVTYCGATQSSPGSVMKSLDPPSAVESELRGSGEMPPPKELHVCLKVENKGSKPARFDRALVELKCPRERQNWQPDSDVQALVLHPGQSRELHVTFHYSPIDPGEDVSLLFDRALTVGGRSLHFEPVVLRRK